MHHPFRRARSARLLLSATAATAALAAVVPAAAPAAAGNVSAGELDWSIANVYVSGGARTWLGYVTTISQGTATASGQATGATVDGSSPKGETANATFTFPATGGAYDAKAHTGTVKTAGTVTFASQAHGYSVSVTDPVVTLNGATGTLAASGNGSAGPYTATQPLFNLDLSKATFSDGANGTQTISGIVPSLATVGTAFPANYQVGAGPDRTPNTFGAFTLKVAVGAQGKIASQRKGVVVINATGLTGAKRGAAVRLSSTTSRKALATGKLVSAKKVSLTLAKGVKRLKQGTYRLWTGKSSTPIAITLR